MAYDDYTWVTIFKVMIIKLIIQRLGMVCENKRINKNKNKNKNGISHATKW